MKILGLRDIRNMLMVLLVSSISGPLPAAGAAAPKTFVESAKLEKLTVADRQKIQRVITLQIRAFERNDETVAFSYSTLERQSDKEWRIGGCELAPSTLRSA